MLVFQLWAISVGILFLGLAWRTRRFRKNLISLNDLPSGNPESQWPKISVVIPACNEGKTIQSALSSLLKVDYPNLEIILVNDRSNDETRQIVDELSLMDARITPVHVNHLRDGWLGKVNALDRGASLSSADWILLSDADVHFAEDSLKKAIHYCLSDQIDFMTVIPDVITNGPILQVMIAQLFHQGSLFFKPHRINDPSHKACYGQGAFMLLRKSRYLLSEKMEWLKMEVVDDTGLALLMRRAGAKMAAVAGKNQIELEWYPNVYAFIRGIEKNAFAFSQYSLPLLFGFVFLVYAVFCGFTIAPLLAGGVNYIAFTTACLAIYLYNVHRQLSLILRLRPWSVAAFPIAFAILPLLFLRAAALTLSRGGVNWRGTFYPLRELKANQRMKLANLFFSPASSSEPPPPQSPTVESSNHPAA